MLLYPIMVPLFASLVFMLIPRRFSAACRNALAFIAAANIVICFAIAFRQAKVISELLRFDALSALVLAGAAFFAAVITAYAIGYFDAAFNWKSFGIYVCWAMACASGIALTNDFVLLLVFWGFLGLTLFLMMNLDPKASQAAKKMLIIVGGTDILMAAGIVIIWSQRNSWMMSGTPLPVTGINVMAFILIAVGALAKAGAFPVHSWLPDAAEFSPAPFTAMLPASLDKLLGIYLLTRVVTGFFEPAAPFITGFLLIIGAITVFGAAMMSLVQKDMKRLLGYCAVSQVGFMVIGIGTGNLIAMAGGLFHMLNHAIYKSSLFMTAGSVEKQTGTTDLDKLGGLAKAMPLTFVSALVASLSISGFPPFNGFFSKWMIYQGLLVSFSQDHSVITIVALLSAMFGTSLTLAAFIKLLHSAYLSFPRLSLESIKEVPPVMWISTMLLSVLCLVLGIGSMNFVVPRIILPALSAATSGNIPLLVYPSGLAIACLLGSIAAGILFYVITVLPVRKDCAYLGGENVDENCYPTGTDFYRTFETAPLLRSVYRWSKNKYLDLYDLSARALRSAGSVLSDMHAGVLNSYVLWVVAGLIALLLVSL